MGDLFFIFYYRAGVVKVYDYYAKSISNVMKSKNK